MARVGNAKRVGQPPARFAFRNREQLMDELGIGNQAADMWRALEAAGKTSPGPRSIDRICYNAQLMKSSAAKDMLRAFGIYATNQNRQINAASLEPQNALVEFNAIIPGLGHDLKRAGEGLLNADVDAVSAIAVHLEVTPETVLQAASGRCVQVPMEFANRLAIAASQVLNKPAPYDVVRLLPNERRYKPIGCECAEEGKAAHLCENTSQIRFAILANL